MVFLLDWSMLAVAATKPLFEAPEPVAVPLTWAICPVFERDPALTEPACVTALAAWIFYCPPPKVAD